MTGRNGDYAAFVRLLERCVAQVQADPSGYVENPHLYDLLDHIHLRLCHGNRAEGDKLERQAKPPK